MNTLSNKHCCANVGLGQEDCPHAVIDEFLCMVTGCALGTDASHLIFFFKSQHGSRSTRYPFKDEKQGNLHVSVQIVRMLESHRVKASTIQHHLQQISF